MLSTAVIVLIVLMALCAVVGAIYAYLYFTRINPAAKGQHRGGGGGGGAGAAGHGAGGGDPHGHRGTMTAVLAADDDQLGAPSTHLFLFRKS